MYQIKFYRVNEAYGCFSNFAKYPIELGGKVYPTSEHYFQAKKFEYTEHEEAIRLAETPMLAANLGRERWRPLREDWEQVKDNIMRQALQAKFDQHQVLKDILLSTGSCELIEHTTNDSYWGDGGDGAGRNMLGILLMELRQTYSEEREFYLPPSMVEEADDAYLQSFAEWLDGLSVEARKEYTKYFKLEDF